MTKRRAFTLIEAAVTVSIAGLVAVAAISMYALINTSFTNTRRVAELSDRLLGTVAYLSRELMTVGGNTASASMSIIVENECLARGAQVADGASVLESGYPACPNNADRLTIFAAVSNTPGCRISHISNTAGGAPRISLWYRDISNVPKCCVNDKKNGSRDGVENVQYVKRHAMLTQGSYFKPVLLIGEEGAPGETSPPAPEVYDPVDPSDVPTSNCTFRIVDVVAPEHRNDPAQLEEWVDAAVSFVDMRTIYIDASDENEPPKLYLHTDKDGNGEGAQPTVSNSGTPNGDWGWADPVAPAQDERLLISEGVYDMQVVLGYDLNGDGEVEGNTEWVHDRPGEDRDLSLNSKLRMIRIDVVMGVKVRDGVGSVSTPAAGGPTSVLQIPKIALRTTSVTVMPRNGDNILAGVN